MKKTYAFIALICVAQLLVNNSYAQVNPDGIGVRMSPDGAGITGKFYLNTHFAIETQINGSEGFNNANSERNKNPENPVENTVSGRSWAGVGLLEYHYVFHNVSWRIFAGAGLHIGKWDRFDQQDHPEEEGPQGIFGVDGIIGAEYLFKSLPLGISADVKPAENFTVEHAYFPNNMIGFSIRYYFGHLVPADGNIL